MHHPDPHAASRRFRVAFAASLCVALLGPATARPEEFDHWTGRWDVVLGPAPHGRPAGFELVKVRRPTGSEPGFLEDVELYVQPPAGARERATRFDYRSPGDSLTFDTPSLGTVSGHFEDERFVGIAEPGGRAVAITAVRAPELTDTTVSWGAPERLFDGRTLAGWRGRWNDAESGWTVKDGALVSISGNDDLVSVKRYTNFKLHLKYWLHEFQDSGVHLRGRYEIQLVDHADGAGPTGVTGAVYGRIEPLPGARVHRYGWNTLDVELVGRRLTARLNGRLIHDRALVAGITGDALDSAEGEPGPIQLQGHLGLVEFRDIVVTPAR